MTDRSYTSNSIEPTESAAEYAHRVLGAPHPDEDTDELQRLADAGHEGAQLALYDLHLADRLAEVRAEIGDVVVYLREQAANPFASDRDVDRIADYLSDLRDEVAELEEQVEPACLQCHGINVPPGFVCPEQGCAR